MGKMNEINTFLCQRLQLLGHVSRLTADFVNVCDIQGQATNLSRTCREGNKAQDGTQEGCLSTTTLACETNQLASAYSEVETAKEVVGAKGESG
jgi:hypothetical protein